MIATESATMALVKLGSAGFLSLSAAIAASTLYTVAQTGSPPDTGWVEPIIQVATTGGFGGLLWYTMAKRIPEMEKQHRDERREWEDRHRQEREDFRVRQEQAYERLGNTTASAVTALKEAIERQGHK